MSIKILIADGFAHEVNLIRDMLCEYTIITASDGLEVLQTIGVNPDIDLILIDLHIPNMDGFQLLSNLSGHEKHKYTRKIILSDSDAAEDEIRCLNLGAHDYIKKTTQLLSLQNRVRNQLDVIRRQKEFENLEMTMGSIFRQAPIGISISHNSEPVGEGMENLVDINLEYERIFGRKRDELLKLGWVNITHPDDLNEDLEQFRKLQSGEIHSYSMDKRFLKPDGTYVWVHIIVAALDITNENKHNHICLMQDITEQKNMLLQTKKDHKIFQAFIDSSRDIIFLKDENSRIVFVNKALADFYRQDKKTLIGKTVFEIMDADWAEVFNKSDREVVKHNKAVNTIEKVNNRALEVHKFPVPIEEGKIGVGAYIRDITTEYELREIIDKISETNKIITQCMLKPFKDVQEQLDYALHEALKLTDSQYGYIYFYDEGTKEFTLNSWTNGVMDDCAVMDKQTKYQLEKTGLWGEVVRRQKPMIVNDFTAANPLKKGYPEGHVQIKKFMSIPIFENNKIVAVIGFANKQFDYTDNDVYTMTVLMSGVWIATKKREKEKETEVLLERTQSMINNHEAVMLLIEPMSGQIIEVNYAAVKFYGYTKEELLGMKIQDINILSDERIRKSRLEVLNKGKSYFTFPHRLKNGEIRLVDVFSTTIEYNSMKVLFSIIFDVTKREMMTRQNEYLIYHDYLTGLYNRRFFDEEFERRFQDGKSYPIGIIWGDINGFKMYNDSFGHLEGDQALNDIGVRIHNCIHEEDIFARVGGDEFAVLVSGTNEEDLRAYLNRVEQQVNGSTGNSALTISFGYGIQRKKDDTMDMLIKEAEAFMYNRKYYNKKSAKSNTVNVIMETLFAKSEREKKHSERVGLISEAIAKAMSMDQQTVDKIRVAGFLHDIGKIGIDESILNKIGILNRNEWEVMKLHSAKGAGILENTIEFQDIADLVLAHHERFDGTGYPNGLREDDIPLAARIITVADAYDAMTNDRSYRNKVSHEAAVEELKRCAGGHFDPEIVSTFLKMPLSEILHTESGEPPVS